MTTRADSLDSPVDQLTDFIQTNFEIFEAGGDFIVRPNRNSDYQFLDCQLKGEKFRCLLKVYIKQKINEYVSDEEINEALELSVGMSYATWESEAETGQKLHDDLLANVVIAFYEDFAKSHQRSGNSLVVYNEQCSTFYDQLRRFFNDRPMFQRKGQSFPGSSSVLSRRLSELQGVFGAHDLDVELCPRNNRGRRVKLRWFRDDDTGSHAPRYPSSSLHGDEAANDDSDLNDGNDGLYRQANALILSSGGDV